MFFFFLLYFPFLFLPIFLILDPVEGAERFHSVCLHLRVQASIENGRRVGYECCIGEKEENEVAFDR